jgi:D-glycero-alpha-D-manno-heptose 1-phosphate guanylyltransferase
LVVTTAIVLAGGLGTRLRDVVTDVPKPMAPVNGRPFLEYQLDYWLAQGVTRFVLSVGYRHEVIVDHFGPCYRDAALDFVVEENPLGTGGAVLRAIEEARVREPFLLLNGDTYFTVSLDALRAFAEANDADWCLSLFRTREDGRYMQIDIATNGRIVSVSSAHRDAAGLANGGVYWIDPRALTDSNRDTGRQISVENDLLPRALALGRRVWGLEFSGTFIDIGVPADYHRAAAVVAHD